MTCNTVRLPNTFHFFAELGDESRRFRLPAQSLLNRLGCLAERFIVGWGLRPIFRTKKASSEGEDLTINPGYIPLVVPLVIHGRGNIEDAQPCL